MDTKPTRSGSKRTDVGYKRPPVEHQFKPGQKPPPRKKRPRPPQSRTELLMEILKEEQRVEIGGKVRWCTKAQLLLLVAFQLAEKGSPTVTRALLDALMLDQLPVSENEPWFEITPPGGPTRTYAGGKEIFPNIARH